jgi:2-methylcitrate dehydratase
MRENCSSGDNGGWYPVRGAFYPLDYTLGLKYSQLPSEVVHEAKRALLDTIGCALGGYDSDASRILQKVITGFKTAKISTIIGDGSKTLPHYAALVNAVMVRYLDYNDVFVISLGPMISGSHPSDLIPAIMAVGEQKRINGPELITNIVIGYELSARFVEAVTRVPLENRGWNPDCRGPFITPLVAGRVLDCTAEQLENAVGISGSRDMILGILDAAGEPYTMAKNMRFSYTNHNGILAALIAKEGFTGPARVLEGDKGFIETVVGGDFEIDKLIHGDGRFKILDTEYKPFAADRTTHGHITATLNLVRQYDLRPEDIAQVRILAGSRDILHTGNPSKKYPYNKESADHSSYYLTAVAIVDREVGPKQYTSEKYNDQVIRELIDKVVMEADPSLDSFISAGISEITTVHGKRFTCKVEHPKGTPQNPMSDEDLVKKFSSMASRYFPAEHEEQIIKMIWELDRLDDVNELMRLLTFH